MNPTCRVVCCVMTGVRRHRAGSRVGCRQCPYPRRTQGRLVCHQRSEDVDHKRWRRQLVFCSDKKCRRPESTANKGAVSLHRRRQHTGRYCRQKGRQDFCDNNKPFHLHTPSMPNNSDHAVIEVLQTLETRARLTELRKVAVWSKYTIY